MLKLVRPALAFLCAVIVFCSLLVRVDCPFDIFGISVLHDFILRRSGSGCELFVARCSANSV